MNLRFAICDLRLREKGPHARRRCSSPATSNQQPATSAFRPGFSFTEILFAVMILGIGFIMVAAMFPVAIKQTAATGEETTAAAIAKSGADYLERNAYDLLKLTQPPYNQPQYASPNYNTMPPVLAPAPPQPASPAPPIPAASVVVAGGNMWGITAGNTILPSDHRYAWVPFYRRDADSNFAQVIVIATQIRNRSVYDSSDFLQLGGAAGNANLQGKPVMVKLVDGTLSTPNVPDTITFTPVPATPPTPAAAGSPDYTGFVAEGCYVVIANDPGIVLPASPATGYNPPQKVYTANGYVYRVGLPRPDISPTTWELMPGNDMRGATYKPSMVLANQGNILAYVVGRGYANPGATPPDTSPTGPAMDIAVYTSFVRVNTPQ